MSAPYFIFDSAAKRIVEFKWDNAQFYVKLEAIPYMIQSIMIFLDTWLYSEIIWLKWLIIIFNGLLLAKLLTKMCLFLNFKYRRECSYHIEFEGYNKLKFNSI